MKSERLEVRLDADLLARLDAARGREPRASFVRWALEQALVGRGEQATPESASPLVQDAVVRVAPADKPASARAPVPDPPDEIPLPKIAGRHWVS